MRVISHALRCLVVSLACLAAVVSAANGDVLEVDVVFPRNETYAPTDSFPVISAFQNAHLAWYLNMDIRYLIRNRSVPISDYVPYCHTLR